MASFFLGNIPSLHIVPFEEFHRIGGAQLETFHNLKYDAPEEVGGAENALTALLGNEVCSKFLCK